jgi:hypothetical protein
MTRFHWSSEIAPACVTLWAIPSIGLAVQPVWAQSLPIAAVSPADNLNALAYFQGTWNCRVREANAPTNQPFADFTWVLKRTLNNYWFLGNVSSPDGSPLAHDTIGFNTLSNKFGRTIITADGGFYNFLSDGWQGRTFTWEGTAVDMGMRTRQGMREVIQQESDRKFTAVYYTQDPTAKTWIADTQEVCEKQSQ